MYYFGVFVLTMYYFKLFLHTSDYHVFIFVYCAHSETNISIYVQRAYCLLNAAEYRRNILILPLSGHRTTAVNRIRNICSGE